MSTFSLSEAARIEIKRIIQTSGYRDAAVALVDMGPPLDLSTDTKAALLKGMDENELEGIKKLVEKEFTHNPGAGVLVVSAYEREECNVAQLCEIDGIPFAMPVALREALCDYTLTYVGGEFMLESPDEVVANLRSVKALAEWFK